MPFCACPARSTAQPCQSTFARVTTGSLCTTGIICNTGTISTTGTICTTGTTNTICTYQRSTVGFP